MKKTIKAEVKKHALSLVTDLTYRQVDHWYGASRKDLKISVIYPKHLEKAAPLPLIIWICGGAFRTMDQNVWLPQMVELAQKGYVVASPQYRTINEVRFPQPLEDIKAAIRYMKAHARDFSVDAERVFVMGESAGGTLASLAAVTGECAEYDTDDDSGYTSKVAACVDIYGVVNFEQIYTGNETGNLDDNCCERFTGPYGKNRSKASAINYINEKTPPVLILHGTKDRLVDIHSQSEEFYKRLQENGVRSDFIILEGADHGDDAFYQAEIMELIHQFLKSV